MEIKEIKKHSAALNSIIEKMVAAGNLNDVRQPIWKAGATLAIAKREEGSINESGTSIVFNELPKELAKLKGKGLRLKGKGPLVRICIAEAIMDWKPTPEMVAENKAKGWKVPTPITKGDEQIRCFC